jgi:hypothetical protein
LEEREIRDVARLLDSKERKHFLIMIAPHHGTHWHDEMRKLRCCNVVSSVGKSLVAKVAQGYKEIATHNFCTFVNGDIWLAPTEFSCPAWRWRPRW